MTKLRGLRRIGAFFLAIAGIVLASAARPAVAAEPAPAATSSAAATKTAETPTATSAKGRHMEIEDLRAGPVRMKFQDGELRYLYVGDKEIVRRIYFAVRDTNWGTPPPVFSGMDVRRSPDARSFRIRLAATSKSDKVEYYWTADITGDPDGTITYKALGEASAAFRTNRIGICLLFGAESLAGQSFDAVGSGGALDRGMFPELISPALVAKDFRQLQYVAADGMTVTLNQEPALMLMEDQRNFGDSSYKVFAMMCPKQDLAKGDRAGSTLTLKLAKVKPGPAVAPVGAQGYAARIRIGKVIEGAKMPRIIEAKDSGGAGAAGGAKAGSFVEYNGKRDSVKDAKDVRISYTPSTHLTDDDTLMENRSAILAQLRTLKSFAPGAKVSVDPITLTDKADDPRNADKFAASWAVGALKYATLGGADEVCFKGGKGPLFDRVFSTMDDFAPLAADTVAAGHVPVEVVALNGGEGMTILVANSTNAKQKVLIEGLPVNKHVSVYLMTHLAETTTVKAGGVPLELGPYEVRIVVVERKDWNPVIVPGATVQ